VASTTVYQSNTTTFNTQFIQEFIVHILTTEIMVLGSGDVKVTFSSSTNISDMILTKHYFVHFVCFCSTDCSFCVISDFCHEIDYNCSLLGYYAASSGNFYQCFGTMYCPHLRGSRIKILDP